MFEIRVICDPADVDTIAAALDETFTVSPVVTCNPTRDGKRVRLYATAEPRPIGAVWPTPEEAYADAPGVLDEIGWLTRTAADWHDQNDREYYLRKAAVYDRIALDEERNGTSGCETEVAQATALYLLDHDRSGDGHYGGSPYWPEHPAAEASPRDYVRQEYAHWRTAQGTSTDT